MNLPDEGQLEGLIFAGSGTPPDRFFLLGQPGQEVIAFWHPQNAIMARIIEDDGLALACIGYLRRRGFPAFLTPGDVYAFAAERRWPDWEQYQPADLP